MTRLGEPFLRRISDLKLVQAHVVIWWEEDLVPTVILNDVHTPVVCLDVDKEFEAEHRDDVINYALGAFLNVHSYEIMAYCEAPVYVDYPDIYVAVPFLAGSTPALDVVAIYVARTKEWEGKIGYQIVAWSTQDEKEGLYALGEMRLDDVVMRRTEEGTIYYEMRPGMLYRRAFARGFLRMVSDMLAV